MLKVRAVLFDLDGTLVDSIPDLAAAAHACLAELGEAPRSEQEITSFVGKGIVHLVERLINAGRATQTEARLAQALAVFERHYAALNGQCSRVYPGALAALQDLRARGIRTGCVTNKPMAFTLPLLEKTGLSPWLDAVVGGDSLAQRKPDPEPLWHACQLLGATTAQSLMVGDSVNDALAARRAGIPVWLVDWGYSEGAPVDSLDCDGVLSAFAQLAERIEPL